MRILLIGYGKMGKAIEEAAKKRGHEIAGIFSSSEAKKLSHFPAGLVDVAIEFTRPEAAVNNLQYCIENGIPVVSGTTGWHNQRSEIERLCTEKGGAFFYASNFSIGVNLFFQLNKYLAQSLKMFPQYNVSIDETHHTQKLDRPSGTAITLADEIISNQIGKTSWVNDPSSNMKDLVINSYREENVVGTHVVHYESEVDSIEIKHTAHSREGFAVGAVAAAEWLIGKKGNFGMNDMLGFK